MKFLLDTCIISEAMKSSPNKNFEQWIEQCPEDAAYVSVLTMGELHKGVRRLPDSQRKTALERWVCFDLPRRFVGRVLVVDDQVAEKWGELSAASERQGIILPVIDSLVAATALVNNLIVVTRNIKDLERCGVRCINPF